MNISSINLFVSPRNNKSTLLLIVKSILQCSISKNCKNFIAFIEIIRFDFKDRIAYFIHFKIELTMIIEQKKYLDHEIRWRIYNNK